MFNKLFKSKLDCLLIDIIRNKIGIEIGGPSKGTGKIIYKYSYSMDNVIFSKDTIWSNHHNHIYKYYKNKEGKVYINEGTEIPDINNESYNFIFASHVLEHIANPLKALKEWIRIIDSKGYLILILPEKSCCFDHKRDVSNFEVILSQYKKNVGEDDLSTLDEILDKHDLSMDRPAGSFKEFKVRSLNNYKNRCLHHYVYNIDLLKEISNYIECKFIYSITNKVDIWFIIQKTF